MSMAFALCTVLYTRTTCGHNHTKYINRIGNIGARCSVREHKSLASAIQHVVAFTELCNQTTVS